MPTSPPETMPTQPAESETEEMDQPKEIVDASQIAAEANSYAVSLGFVVDNSLSKNNSGYYCPDYRPIPTNEIGTAAARDLVSATKNQLNRLEIDRLVSEEQVRYFYVGGYGGFDQIAATAVKKVKKKYPDITLMLVLPYHPAERPIEKPPGYDGTYYPEGLEKTPRPFAIVKANQLMVDSCQWLVCYVRHGASNSRNLLEYAQHREKKGLIQITNIAEGMGTNL